MGDQLITAAIKGDIAMVSKLLNRGVNINSKDNDDDTALMKASLIGHTDIVKLLVDKGALWDLQNEEGDTALMYASLCGHTDIVQLLIDKEALLDLQDEDDYTALIKASNYGRTKIVKLLIDKGASLDFQNIHGDTALALASWKGHTNIVKLLVDKGADTAITSNYEKTAKDLAAKKGHTKIVALLEKHERENAIIGKAINNMSSDTTNDIDFDKNDIDFLLKENNIDDNDFDPYDIDFDPYFYFLEENNKLGEEEVNKEFDVLFKRGKLDKSYGGNRHYRKLVIAAIPFYATFPDGGKAKVSEQICAEIMKLGPVRFIQVDKTCQMTVITDKKAVCDKICQALRDAKDKWTMHLSPAFLIESHETDRLNVSWNELLGTLAAITNRRRIELGI